MSHWLILRLINAQSLVNCDLKFILSDDYQDRNNDYELYRNMVGGLLDKLRHVKRLSIDGWCAQVLSMLELKGMRYPLFKWESLMLDRSFKEWEVPGIATLLKNSPHIESLVINMFVPYEEYQFEEYFPENYWESLRGSYECSLKHLKTVKIIHFPKNREKGFRFLVELVVEASEVLEELVIHTTGYSEEELQQLVQVLDDLPSPSPYLEIYYS